MSISQTRKTEAEHLASLCCSWTGRQLNPEATFFHILSILGCWCGKLPWSIKEVYARKEVFSKVEVCLNRSCSGGRGPGRQTAQLCRGTGLGKGMVCVGNSE